MENNINIRLKGEELSAVQFVLDYLQIHFQNKGFTFFVWPTIEISGNKFVYGDLEYRNKLCELIGQIVTDVKIIEDDILLIEFENSKIIENINPNNPEIISEICNFQDDGEWWVW